MSNFQNPTGMPHSPSQLLQAGFPPALVIEEDDGKLAALERGKFEKRIEGNALAPEIAEMCTKNNIERVTVKQHNFSDSFSHIARVKPRLLVRF
jgi:hypothetical protein